MVQDIFPHKYDNRFVEAKPADSDPVVVCFQQKVLCRIETGKPAAAPDPDPEQSQKAPEELLTLPSVSEYVKAWGADREALRFLFRIDETPVWLCDRELSSLGRIHTAARARDRIAAVMGAGLDLSVDLMCATPGQTDASWEETLEGVTGFGVGHVSVYPLQVEEGTPMERSVELELEKTGEAWPAWNSDEVQASRMELAERVLRRSGLSRYEVASYAIDGRECRHNISYWTGVPYLGLGTGASSMLTREGYERLRGSCCPQLPKLPGEVARVRLTVESGREEVAREPRMESLRLSTEPLDERQAAAEDLMLEARLSRGISPGLLAHAQAVLDQKNVEAVLGRVVKRGLAAWSDDGWLAPTEDGWLLGNELYGELWGLA